MINYCCDFMREQLTHTCDLHGDGGKCPDVLIEKARFQGGEGQIILIARNAEYECNFCPYCGTEWKSVNQLNRITNKNAFMHRSLCPYAGTCKYDISECLTCTGQNRGA